MKVTLDIRKSFSQEMLTIQAPERSQRIDQVIEFVEQLDHSHRLKGKKNEETYLLDPAIIDRIYIENRQVLAEAKGEHYTLSLRLYQVLELLPANFIKISQSEIVNLKAIQRFTITPNGLVEIHLTSGQVTYSSRRYLKSIKEKLQ